MKLFDSHSHLNYEEFSEDERQQRIREIEADADLQFVMDIGCDLPTSRLAAAHARRYDWCYAAVGFHPHYAAAMGEEELAEIGRLAAEPGVRAIGEIGLDFHYDLSPRDVQENCFRRQIRLALERRLPIVIHSREADRLTMDILESEGAFAAQRRECFPRRPVPAGWTDAAADARVLLHCFSGSAELGEEYVRRGAWISAAGPLTYRNNRRTVRVVERIPSAFLLAETDAPYLTPEPLRGRPNRSSYVIHTVRRMAEIKELPPEEMARITCRNAERFFDL
ncbi:MAG: TatD family hydrolase [Anaerovoracaceae bacterium]|jgi:TatD DNase family protein